MAIIATLFIVAALAYTSYWMLVTRHHEETEDAYVQGNVVQITPQVQGIGLAFFFMPVQTLMLANITPDRMAAAAGLSNFLRTAGAAMGTAISVTGWEHLSSAHRAHLVENITPFATPSLQFIDSLRKAGMSTEQAYAALDKTITAQSMMLATNDFFLYCAIAFYLLTGLVWLTKPKKF